MNATNNQNDHYIITKHDGSKLIHLLKANTKKRSGQLRKFCERCLNKLEVDQEAKGLFKDEVLDIVARSTKKRNYAIKNIETSLSFVEDRQMDFSDIEIFKSEKR